MTAGGKVCTSVAVEGTEVFLALGSNLGDREAFFRFGLKQLRSGGFEVRKVSPFYETDPVDCEAGVPPFLNGVVWGRWRGTPELLLDLCQSLERLAGRPAEHSSRQSRELDLDIILFGDRVIHSSRLTIPHPRAAQRVFVLRPLHDIAPDAFFPDCGKTVSELLENLSAPTGIQPYGISGDGKTGLLFPRS